MNNIIKRVWNQSRMVNIEDLSGATFQAESGGHTFAISGVDDTGAAVALSGTVAGVFRRPDNADIALTGAASGGVASVTLTDDCYAVPGRFGLTIFVTSGGQKVAVYAAVGTVAVTSGGAVAGDTPQDVVDLINAIAAAVATIPADYTDLMAAIAPTYSPSALYPVGSYRWNAGKLYRSIVPITTAETWTAAHWTAAVLGDDITDVKSIIELSNSITPKISITPNPKTINNVFVDVLGPGKTYIYGTCSGDARLDYYLDSSNLPNGFSRGSDYYAVVIGTDKDDTYISSYSGGAWVNILSVGKEWKSFTAPSSGGLRISTFLRTGKTYNETMYLVILNKNAYTDMIANGRTDMTDVKNKLTETSLILNGSNLGVNYAAASTETRTFNGLTFTASGGNVTIDGTSSGVSFFDMFRKAAYPSAAFPFVKGKTYTISFHESDSTPIYKQVEYKATESSSSTSLYSRAAVEDVFTFTMPDCYDFHIRFTCDTSGRTYNDKVVYVDIKENSTQDANTIIVDSSGNGDFILLKDGIAAGMKRYGTKVIVKPGFYDLVAEFGKSYLDSLSGNDYGAR